MTDDRVNIRQKKQSLSRASQSYIELLTSHYRSRIALIDRLIDEISLLAGNHEIAGIGNGLHLTCAESRRIRARLGARIR